MKILRRWIGLVAVVAAVVSVAAFAAPLSWWFDLVAHFRIQYAALAFVSCAAALALRMKKMAFVAGAAFVVNLACIAPYLGGGGGRPLVRVLSFNVHTGNPNETEIVRFIEQSGTDVAFLFEVDDATARALGRVSGYRLVAARPAADNFGIAALAKTTVTSTRVIELLGDIPAIEVVTDGVALLGVHTVPPLGAAMTKHRDMQLAQVAQWAREHPKSGIVGDLNATVWSTGFAALDELRGGRALGPSWPNGRGVLRLFAVRIDHALARGMAVSSELGPALGSDHAALLVTFSELP